MEYFRRVVRDLTQNFVKSTKPEEVVEVTRADAYFHMIYKILVWEDPMLSWTIFGVFHVLFWIIVHFQLRLYGIVFLAILVVFLTDLYFERTGLQAQRNASSETIREVVNFFIGVFTYLKSLRKDNPSMFCGLMCSIFLGLSMVSRNIPGYFLAYMLSQAIFFGPLLVSKLPSEYKESIRNAVHRLSTNEGMLAETELIPFISNRESNEKDPDLESLYTDKTADSVTSSLITGLNTMPSYLEAEGSLDGLEEDDLVPQLNTSRTSHSPVENSSDSDSEHKNMRFESGHFNGDSSSEDENYTKGLRFSEVRDVPDSPARLNLQAAMTQSLGAGIISNIAAMGTSLMSNVLKTPLATSTESPTRKDSDSDFEIINSDEADDAEHT